MRTVRPPRLPRFPRLPGRKAGPTSLAGLLATLIAAGLIAYTQYRDLGAAAPPPRTTAPDSPGRPSQRSTANDGPERSILDDGGIGRLYREKRSDVFVEAGGTVARLLPDDDHTADGSSRHQRFVVRLPTGDTVLVAHNIDIAPRVPLRAGDAVRFRGEYEWTNQGGVIHWTHADPRRQRPDPGWIEHAGRRYR